MEIEIYFKLCDLLIEYWYEEDGIEFNVLSVDGETDNVQAFERANYSAIKAELISALEARADRDRDAYDAWRSEYARNY